MRAYLQIIRPVNGIMAAVGAWTGMLVAGATVYPTNTVLLGLLAVFFIQSGGMAINDYSDAEIDRINKPKRPIPSGKIKKRNALAFSLLLFAAGVFSSYLISYNALIVAALAAAILISYAAKLKKTLLLGHVMVSLLVAFTFIFGGIVAGNYTPALLMAFLAFVSNMAREIYKSIEDVLGDKRHDVKSLAIRFGVLKAKLVANAFVIFAVLFSFVPYLLGIFGVVYLFFVVIADIIFVLAVSSPARYSAKFCKLAMLIALFAFLAAAIKI